MGDTSDDDVTLVALSALLLGYGIKLREGRKKKRRKQRTLWSGQLVRRVITGDNDSSRGSSVVVRTGCT